MLMWMLFFGFLFHRYGLEGISGNPNYLDFLMPGEIRTRLAKADPETYALLERFLDAVDRWFLMNRMMERRVNQDSVLDEESVSATQRRTTP